MARVLETEYQRNSFEAAEDTRDFSPNPTRMYLAEIGQFPLLKPEEEIRLARQFVVCRNIIRDAGDLDLPVDLFLKTHPEFEDDFRAGEIARNRLIESNLRLVVSIASKYLGRGLPFPDLMQEGNIGLAYALEKFDPRRAKLSTYATWWIKNNIIKAVKDQGRIIRLPAHRFEEITHLSKVSSNLEQQLERLPTDQELSDQTGFSSEKINELFLYSMRPLSLDAPLSEDDDTTLADLIADPEQTETPIQNALNMEYRSKIEIALEQLTNKERVAIRARYGFEPYNFEHTLEEIGKELGFSRERARQVLEKGLAKLRVSPLQEFAHKNGDG